MSTVYTHLPGLFGWGGVEVVFGGGEGPDFLAVFAGGVDLSEGE